jgi:DNA-binding transcriptional LysR family regulator
LIVPRFAASSVLGPKLAKFTHDYPDVILDITADDSRMDIVAGASMRAFTTANTSRKT